MMATLSQEAEEGEMEVESAATGRSTTAEPRFHEPAAKMQETPRFRVKSQNHQKSTKMMTYNAPEMTVSLVASVTFMLTSAKCCCIMCVLLENTESASQAPMTIQSVI